MKEAQHVHFWWIKHTQSCDYFGSSASLNGVNSVLKYDEGAAVAQKDPDESNQKTTSGSAEETAIVKVRFIQKQFQYRQISGLLSSVVNNAKAKIM